jgi:hypothetical protein
MQAKLEDFWKEHGERYCKEHNFEYILLDKSSKLNQHEI